MRGEEVHLSGDDFHHIVHVCRQAAGNVFEVLVGDGKAYLIKLVQVDKKSAVGHILETRDVAQLKKPYIHLVLSLPKFPTFEAVLEKAVELGVSEITPIVSDYSFIRKLPGPLEKKYPRWQKIIQSATQQCGRAEKMQLHPAQTLDQMLESFNQNTNAAGLFAYEGEATLSLPKALAELAEAPKECLYLFVGSEGGFSTQEVEKFSSHHLKSVSLGEQVLRVETACIALVSILKYHFQL